MPAPIIIMSFNRAQFLAPVLSSLKAQEPDGVAGREVHLFQDGAVNRYSRLRYANPIDIDASVNLFRREFPEGVVHSSEDNIGICENYRRAEHYIFVDRRFNCAWFFEDDLVLSPSYFQMMERLQNFSENMENVAYFSAYGNYYATPEELTERRRELITLDHHWGFGLLERHWRSLQDRLRTYYDVVVGTDYTRRDHRKIFAIYQAGKGAPRASSQDAAKAFACDQGGLWRCNTLVPFARYIGASGQHMTPELFKDLGYDNAWVSQTPVLDLQLPGSSGIREKVLEQRQLFETIWREELREIIAKLPPAKLNPMRFCSREDIIAAYFLLLRRPVEGQQIIAEHVGTRPVQTLVSAIMKSREFDELVDGSTEEFTFRDAMSRGMCSAKDIHDVYALLCHREPESAVMDRHEGITQIDLLVEGVVRSAEFRLMQQQFVP